MKILLTGGCGYIGSHMAHTLVDRGDEVQIIDDLSEGSTRFILRQAALHEMNYGDREGVLQVLKRFQPDVVYHFAGNIVQPESINEPEKYYKNNTFHALSFLSACMEAGADRVVFSSTAAVYGSRLTRPLVETDPIAPETPYGRSKAAAEWLLEDLARVSALRYAVLRYFNVAGADVAMRCGQCSRVATHLLKVAMEVATGRRDTLYIYGTDYETRDGTCIRDYIHVSDLVRAHVLAGDLLVKTGKSDTFNLGTGNGYSVREVIEQIEACVGAKLRTQEHGPRLGDAPVLLADSTKAERVLGWRPELSDMVTIASTAWEWERRLQNMSGSIIS